MHRLGLSVTDLSSSPMMVFLDDTNEIKRNVAPRKIQKRKITFESDFFEDIQRVKSGFDPVPVKKTKKETVTDMKPPREPKVSQFLNGALSVLARGYNNMVLYTGCKAAPPKGVINAFAFYPPSPWKWYYLSYYNEEKQERTYGTAKHCFEKRDIRIEPVTDFQNQQRVSQVKNFLERTEPFIVYSSSGNYLVCAKIKAKSCEKNHKVLIVAQSNACDVGLCLIGYGGFFISYQHPDDYDVYIFDYSGYGLSTGNPSEDAVYKDIESVYDYVVKERNDPDLEVILFGISIGTAVVTDLAAKNPKHVTGVVLVAPLTSGIRHIARYRPPKKTSSVDCFRTLDKVPKVQIPILCIHGLKDSMMPPSNSTEIYSAAPFGVDPLFIPNRCHLGVLGSFRIGTRLADFIEDDIELWKLGCSKQDLIRKSHMVYEEFKHDKDTETDDESGLKSELTDTSSDA